MTLRRRNKDPEILINVSGVGRVDIYEFQVRFTSEISGDKEMSHEPIYETDNKITLGVLTS